MARILRIVLATLIALGFAAVLRVYPETESNAGGLWATDWTWHDHTGRCSLVTIMSQGFEYEPVVADSRMLYHRSPSWLWMYAGIVPALWVAAFFGIRGAVGLGRFWRRSLRRLLSTWPRRVIAILAAVSLVCQAVSAWFISVGGQVGAGFVGSLLYDCSAAVGHLLFPLDFINRAMVYFGHIANMLLCGWTSPPLGFPTVGPYINFPRGYSYSGPPFEIVCLILMAAAWVILVRLICDGGATLARRWRGRVKSQTA